MKSKILFPAGLTRDLTGLDLEVMSYYTKKWSLEHSQMQEGIFSGGLYAVYTPRIQILDAHYSHGSMIRGEFPDNCVLIGYIRSHSVISQYNENIDSDKVVILTEGDEIDYLTSGENKVFTLAVEKEFFFQAFNHYFGEPFNLHQENKQFKIKKGKISQLIISITYWMGYLRAKYTSDVYEKIETEILGNIFETLDLDIQHYKHTNLKAADIREILDTSLYEIKSMSDIASQVGISQRHMRRLFKETFGIAPKAYLQNLRLNAIRKELLYYQQTDSYTISDIASNYNFLHMGYFSAEYKKMFGELPSASLKR